MDGGSGNNIERLCVCVCVCVCARAQDENEAIKMSEVMKSVKKVGVRYAVDVW